MNLMIVPFEGNFRKELDLVEYDEVNAADVKRIIQREISPDKAFHVSLHKGEGELYMIMYKDRISIFRNPNDPRTDDEVKIDSLEEAVDLIIRYAGDFGDQYLEDFIRVKKKELAAIQKEKYDAWKERYEDESKKDKKSYLKRLVVVFSVVALIFYTVRLIWTGEINFIGRETELVDAVVTKAEYYKEAGRHVYQEVIYQFEFEDEKYYGKFKANKFTGAHEVGDSIVVKIRVSNPNVSKRIGRK